MAMTAVKPGTTKAYICSYARETGKLFTVSGKAKDMSSDSSRYSSSLKSCLCVHSRVIGCICSF